uniref:C2 domain-containing protein n=1 Tax=Hucho hucho TaxID=62062 RepID=A0A4W5RZS9_9TELE
VKNTLDPVWQAFKIPVKALCNGDYDSMYVNVLNVCVCSSRHDFIGEFSTRYREMSRGQSQFHTYEVVNQKKRDKKKKRYLNSGTVISRIALNRDVIECSMTDASISSLFDFVSCRTQINFTVAIDFTASNGNPSQPTSLHYMSPYQLNAYAMALRMKINAVIAQPSH